MKVLLCVIFLVGAVDAREFSDEEYYQLPQLFQLDDYQQCLSRSEGLYCMGTFHIKPAGTANEVYELVKEYSSEPHNFNRTLIHRGYCVSSRCPDLNGSYVKRFQLCTEKINQHLLHPGSQLLQTADKTGDTLQSVEQPGRTQTSLVDLKYCHTRAEAQEKVPLDTAKLIFLVVICSVVLLNLIGTVCDAKMEKANKLLMAWSVWKNWKQLTSSKKAANSSLEALHGIRVCITLSACLLHAMLPHFMSYTYNPRTLEHIISHPLSMLVQNGTSTGQMMFVISGFFLACQLHLPGGQLMGPRAAAVVVAKRIFRFLPVFLLVVGFAATWWPAMGSGPLWFSVEAESRICRDKFWTHMLFVNNLVDPGRLCVLTTWFIAADFQLMVITTIILVVLMLLRILKPRVLVVIFVSSALLNTILAYAFNWSPMLYLTSSPEKIRILFRDEPSFAGLYLSPWGNMPAWVLGLIVGHLYTKDAVGHWNVMKLKWLLKPICIFSVPALLSWIVAGYWLQHVTARPFVVAYITIERNILQTCYVLSFVVTCQVGGFWLKVLSWRGWLPMSRLSYAVMLLHWIVNLYIVGSTPQPLTTSILDIGLITAFFSFLLAIPVTIMVEMPIQKLFAIITSRPEESKKNEVQT